MLSLIVFACLYFSVYCDYPDTYYEITFYTGNDLLAGTSANVYIKLFGTKGSTSNIKIPSSWTSFKPGSTDSFQVDAGINVGEVLKIIVSHDNANLAAGWYLSKVFVEPELSNIIYKFYINKWVDDNKSKGRYLTVQSSRANRDNCGFAARPRVVNGDTAFHGQWPWQAQIKLGGSFMPHHCGGTLVHPQYVLTAAHCVADKPDAKLYTITMGEYDLIRYDRTEQRFSVGEIIIHPKYSRKYFEHDLALIKLGKPVQLNSYVKTACLPEYGFQLQGGKKCYITGWGNLYGGGPTPRHLQQAYLPSADSFTCNQAMRSVHPVSNPITSNMVCGGGNYKSGCHGDSGGPYVCPTSSGQFFIQGTVSWGSPTCKLQNRYTVFVRVAQYVDWIESNIYSNYV